MQPYNEPVDPKDIPPKLIRRVCLFFLIIIAIASPLAYFSQLAESTDLANQLTQVKLERDGWKERAQTAEAINAMLRVWIQERQKTSEPI